MHLNKLAKSQEMEITTSPLSIEEVKKLGSEDFVRMFKDVVENYDAAAKLIKLETFHNVMDIYSQFSNVLDRLGFDDRSCILKKHPGLKKHLSDVVDLSIPEKCIVTHYIEQYEDKFKFSFVICEKETKGEDILKAVSERLKNDIKLEVNVGIEEVKKIIKYRVLQLVKHEYA